MNKFYVISNHNLKLGHGVVVAVNIVVVETITGVGVTATIIGVVVAIVKIGVLVAIIAGVVACGELVETVAGAVAVGTGAEAGIIPAAVPAFIVAPHAPSEVFITPPSIYTLWRGGRHIKEH